MVGFYIQRGKICIYGCHENEVEKSAYEKNRHDKKMGEFRAACSQDVHTRSKMRHTNYITIIHPRASRIQAATPPWR
jgi:hypothetical protein